MRDLLGFENIPFLKDILTIKLSNICKKNDLPMGVSSMTLEYINYYIQWAPIKVRMFVYYSYIHAYYTWKFGWKLCSQHYSHETLFISVLFIGNTIHSSTITEIPTLFTIFLLFILALFIICTNFSFYLFS